MNLNEFISGQPGTEDHLEVLAQLAANGLAMGVSEPARGCNQPSPSELADLTEELAQQVRAFFSRRRSVSQVAGTGRAAICSGGPGDQ